MKKRTRVLSITVISLSYSIAQAHDIGHSETPSWDPPMLTQEQRDASPEVNAMRYVIDRYKLWRTGNNLNVCFFDGAPDLRRAVADIARIWTRDAHITFDFGPEPGLRSCNAGMPSHIRIAFKKAGNWSYVGRDSVAVDLAQPSMNLEVASTGQLSLIERHELKRVVLHEFGHALGLQHEHQSPKSNCEAEINWSVVYTEMAKPPNNWSKQTVDTNLKSLVLSPRLEISPYDKSSIMHYSLPSWMFNQQQRASCFVTPNETLSNLDELGAKAAYPGTLAEQALYLDNLDKSTMAAIKERQLTPEVAKGVVEQINSNLSGPQAFPERSLNYEKIINVCAQQGIGLVGNVSGSTITNNASGSTNSGSCNQPNERR